VLWVGPGARAEVLAPPLPQRAVSGEEGKREARKAYDKAVALVGRRRVKKALEPAKLAYAMLPNASTATLYAIILGEAGQTRQAFERALIARSLEPTGDERKLIDEYLARYGERLGLGWAAVEVTPASAQVTIGDVTFEGGRTIGLSAGRHAVKVTAPGYQERTVDATATAGALVPIIVALVAEAPAAPPEPPPGATPGAPDAIAAPALPPPAGRGGLGDAGLGLMIGGAVMVIGGIPATVWALGRAKDSEGPAAVLGDAQANPGLVPDVEVSAARASYDAARDDIDTGNILAGVLYGVGGAALIAGVVLFLLDDPVPADGVAPEGARLRVAPALAPGGAVLSVGLTY
jgi:hypothetical protein